MAEFRELNRIGVNLNQMARVEWLETRNLPTSWGDRAAAVMAATAEAAYQERRRVWERASQPLVPSRFPSHDKPQRCGPERGGPERDYGPSR